MRFAPSDEQAELQKSARAVLRARSTPETVRRVMVGETGRDDALWQVVGRELGWAALVVPEEHGGVGLGWLEAALVLGEVGASLACVPLFATVALGTNAVLAAATDEQKRALLPPLAAGELVATLAWLEGDRHEPGLAPRTLARPLAGGGWSLSGTKRHVVEGHAADAYVVSATLEGTSELGLFWVEAGVRGLSRRAHRTLDLTRRVATLALDGVEVAGRARLGGEIDARAALALTLDRAAIALAAEQLGGLERVLDMAVDYAKTRVQFGRPIGSFQAIKHTLADMLVAVESSRSAVWHAAWVADHAPDEVAEAASLAKAWVSDAYLHASGENIQVHGGIGFTWEHEAHLYFKRARSSATLLGDGAHHRDRFAALLGLDPVEGP